MGFLFEVKTKQYRTLYVEAENADVALKIAQSTPIEQWQIQDVPESKDGPICDGDGYPLENDRK